MKRFYLTMTILALFTTPSDAFAQKIPIDLVSTTSTTTTSWATGLAAVTFIRWQNSTARMRKVEQYTRLNKTAVLTGLALGGGDAIDDMGKMLDLNTSQIKQWGKRLRRDQKHLAKMNTSAFVQAIVQHAMVIRREEKQAGQQG